MHNLKIKASQVSNLTDARYFAALGVDYLGFKLDLSHDERLSAPLFYAIKEWVEGPKIVAEIGKTPIELIYDVFNEDDFDLIQSELTEISSSQLTSVKLQTLSDINAYKPSEIYLLNLEEIDEESLYHNKEELIALCNRMQLIFPAPSQKENILSLIQEIKPYGIEVKGSAEEKVGFKSYDDLDEFFDILHA